MADRLIVYRGDDDQYRWRRVAGNNEIVSEGEAHTRLFNAIRAASREFPGGQILIEDGAGQLQEFIEKHPAEDV